MLKAGIYKIVNDTGVLIRRSRWLTTFLYRPLKKFARQRILTLNYTIYLGEKLRIKPHVSQESNFKDSNNATIGIIRDPYYSYEAYTRACQKLKVPYKTIDIFASDWIELIKNSGCDIFVVWPGECIAEWKKLFDERLWFLTNHLKKKLYPSYESLWLYGSKERQRDWLKLHGFSQPQTEIFFRQEDALVFVQRTQFPLVAKTDIGSAAYGVYILKSKSQATRLIKKVFSRGIVGHCADRNAWQWQHILLQEYLDGELEEWRMVRIGSSYFGHLKGRGKDGMHSGSGFCEYRDPGRELLDLTQQITDAGNFESMALDVFKTADGRLLINEMQAVFGCAVATTQMKINNVPGRYVNLAGEWHFEPGEFCGNNMCDLRIDDVLRKKE